VETTGRSRLTQGWKKNVMEQYSQIIYNSNIILVILIVREQLEGFPPFNVLNVQNVLLYRNFLIYVQCKMIRWYVNSNVCNALQISHTVKELWKTLIFIEFRWPWPIFKVKGHWSHCSWFRLSTTNSLRVVNFYVKIIKFQGQ
jgi:hypothetical protein